jgi:hypothetical protein
MSEDESNIRAAFAALAMNGLLSGQTNSHADEIITALATRWEKDVTYAEYIARDAVMFADALLKELKQKS